MHENNNHPIQNSVDTGKGKREKDKLGLREDKVISVVALHFYFLKAD